MRKARVERAVPLREQRGFPLLLALIGVLNDRPGDWRGQVSWYLDGHAKDLEDLRQELSDIQDFATYEQGIDAWAFRVLGLDPMLLARNADLQTCAVLFMTLDVLVDERVQLQRQGV